MSKLSYDKKLIYISKKSGSTINPLFKKYNVNRNNETICLFQLKND